MGKKGSGLLIAVIVLAVLAFVFKDELKNAIPFSTSGGGAVQPTSFGTTASLSVKGVDVLAGSAANVNAELWSSDGRQTVAETNANAALTSLATNLPNVFSGFVMLGNDNYQSGSDRGTEYYYVRYPVGWNGVQGLVTYDNINTYAEETSTTFTTGYDQNAVEATTNVTIGSGGTYTDAAVKLTSTSNLAIGNPTLPQSLGVCFNQSSAGMFKEVRPANYVGRFAVPGFLSGHQVIDQCYILGDSIKDGGTFSSDLFIEANAGKNPGVTDYVHFIPMDKTFYKNDNLQWVEGWGDESDLAADADVGIDSIAASKTIWMT